jgi:NB-ARC domain
MQRKNNDQLATFEELKGLIQQAMGSSCKRLLILDDVWDIDLVRTLKVLQLSGTSSCIVTTRRGDLDWDVKQVKLTVPHGEIPPFAEAMLACYVSHRPEDNTLPASVQVCLLSGAPCSYLAGICALLDQFTNETSCHILKPQPCRAVTGPAAFSSG